MVTKEFSDNALQSVPNNSVAGLFTGGYPKPRMCAIVLLPDNKKRPSGDHSGTIGQS